VARPRPSKGSAKAARERASRIIPSENFKLIAGDPLKAQIVAVALHRLYSPSEYAREHGIDLNVSSYLFKVLREKGVLELVEKVPVRGSVKHMYRATEAAIVSDADWGELAEALRPIFTGVILQDFSARVTQAIETEHLYSRDDFVLYWTPGDLDEIAWEEEGEIVRWCIEEFKRLEEDTVNRRANGESKGSFHMTFAIAAFPSPTHSEFKAHEAKRKKAAGRQEAAMKASEARKAKPTTKGKKKTKASGGRKRKK
jgi:hypothetical protein